MDGVLLANMRLARTIPLLLLLLPDTACGGRVKQALFGSIFGSKKGDHFHADSRAADKEQAELVDFLRANGFGKYAHKDYIEKLDEELAYDAIEDMTHLVADNDYLEINMPHDDAVQIQRLARYEMLKRFLSSVPLPKDAEPKLFTQHLDALIAAGYDEPDDVADLEEEESEAMGISQEHARILTTYAEEYETRLLLHVIITTLTDASGGLPYASEAKWRPMVDALIKVGVRSLKDVLDLTSAAVSGIAKDDLVALQNDPRVLRHAQKQEL